MRDVWYWAVVSIICCVWWNAEVVSSCSEQVCASIVSKCMLTQACKCDLKKDGSCVPDCAKCLGHLYTDCCSCLDLPRCDPRPSSSDKASQVDDFEEPFPELFNALAEEKEPELKWTSMTFPIDMAPSQAKKKFPKKVYTSLAPSNPQDTAPPEQVTVNCTVLYMSQCMSSNKCKETCKSMGAAAYRWFFDGCCECVGLSCINYGVNESRCIQCPEVGDIEYDEALTDEFLADTPYDVDDQLIL